VLLAARYAVAFFASSCRIHAGTGAGASIVDSTGAADE
jgi:hypothetical protein